MDGIRIATESKIKDWKIIFECWQREMEAIVKLCGGHDAPYLHAEHGSTHHFGVSASKCGLGTIREVIGTRKGGGARLDLCIIHEGVLDIIEAKWLEFECSSTPPLEKISLQMGRACHDASTYENINPLFHSRVNRRSGILFISPFFKKKVNPSNIENLINEISSGIDCDLMAWSFPKKSNNLKYWDRYYPGTIAIARCNER